MFRNSGEFLYQGESGYFWSNGASSDILSARYLNINGVGVNPVDNSYKTSGLSVRIKNILHKFPFSLPYSGYVNRDSGATVNQGTGGNFWSTGAGSATGVRYLAFNGVHVWPELDAYKTHGFSVRCVARKQYPPQLSHSRFRTQDKSIENLATQLTWVLLDDFMKLALLMATELAC